MFLLKLNKTLNASKKANISAIDKNLLKLGAQLKLAQINPINKDLLQKH